MPPNFVYTRRVQFADTDLAGIVHFANFYRYMEEAEHEFFRSLGMRIMETQSDGSIIGWPRVRAACGFESPAFYEDELQIEVAVTRVGVKSLTMTFTFRRGETRIATGDFKTVCCRFQRGGQFESIEIPLAQRARLLGEPA